MFRRGWRCPVVWAATVLFCVCTSVFSLQAAETNRVTRTPRPFYIIGHRADNLKEAEAYLKSGVNGLEMDVDILPGRTNALCIAHGPDLGIGPGKTNSPPLADYLKELHELARRHTNFCLVLFDCKPLVSTPEGGAILLHDIRKYLVGSGDDRVAVNVLISVGKIRQKAIFSRIAGDLNPNEALLVDGENDPAKVARFFESLNVKNQAYGDGIGFFNTCLGHFAVWFAVKKGCQLRDENHKIRFVVTWTVDDPFLMTQFIKVGVDAILVDRKFHPYNFSWANMGNGLRSLTRIVQRKGATLGIRLADRHDKPFSMHEPVQLTSHEPTKQNN